MQASSCISVTTTCTPVDHFNWHCMHVFMQTIEVFGINNLATPIMHVWYMIVSGLKLPWAKCCELQTVFTCTFRSFEALCIIENIQQIYIVIDMSAFMWHSGVESNKGCSYRSLEVLCIREHPAGVVVALLTSVITTPQYIWRKTGVLH